MMEQVKVSHAEALKQEFMERYGLREDQVHLQVTVYTTNLELGRKVLADHDTKYPSSEHLPEGETCDSVYSDKIHLVYVHRKDGFYGSYVVGEEDDSES